MDPLAQAMAQAVQQHQRGQLEAAAEIYRAILNHAPHHADALHLLGLVALQKGEPQPAVDLIQRAITANPGCPDFYNNLSTALRAAGRPEAALESCRKAVGLAPDSAEAHYNCGNALQELGKPDEAVPFYRRCVELRPNLEQAHNNLGNALTLLGRLAEAEGCYRQALQINGNSAKAHNNIGLSLQQQGRVQEAETFYRRALELDPGFAEAHNNLGNAVLHLGQAEEAVACYQRALALNPQSGHALAQLTHQQQILCRWDEVARLTERLISAVEQGSAEVPPFTMLSLPTTAEQQLRCARQWAGRRFAVNQRMSEPHDQQKHVGSHLGCDGKAKLRIGYFSADLREHPIGRHIVEVIEAHNRELYEITGYSYGFDDDSRVRRRLVDAFDRFLDVRNETANEIAQTIREDRVDILVDLTGYTENARTEVLALRPAPIQVNYLGYPGTMGASIVDYIVVDPFLIPMESERFFTESLVYMPHCYQANDSRRETAERTVKRDEFGLPEEGLVFCCFNNVYKITREVFRVWMRLLMHVPGSVLWLLESNDQVISNLTREAEASGVSGERLRFAPRVPAPDHLARHRLADLCLDTFPYNAHTTASDALWVGCPVLTIAGGTFASRVAGSLIRTVGLPELITHSLEEYEETALQLVSSEKRLAEIRTRLLQNRSTTPLFDGRSLALHLESAYAAMWENYVQGEKASEIRISSAPGEVR